MLQYAKWAEEVQLYPLIELKSNALRLSVVRVFQITFVIPYCIDRTEKDTQNGKFYASLKKTLADMF